MELRTGGWIQTFTGRKFYPLDPRPEDFCVDDVAHALSNICRFTGHTKDFYSVAEHSVRVCGYLASTGEIPEVQYAGLMHDCAEAYVNDIARPLKRTPEFQFYREAEEKIMVLASLEFGFIHPKSEAIDNADNVLLATEVRDLMADPPEEWASRYGPKGRYPRLTERITPWHPAAAKSAFLSLYKGFNMSSPKDA